MNRPLFRYVLVLVPHGVVAGYFRTPDEEKRAIIQRTDKARACGMVETEATSFGWRLFIRDGAESLSRATLYKLELRIEEAIVPAAGVAGVFTEERARGRGLARRIMQRAIELMKEHSFALSFLYGIPALYGRWGFRTCSARQEVVVATRELEMHLQRQRIPMMVSHRTATEADRNHLTTLYTQNNFRRTGTLVRETSPWSWYRHGSVFGHPPAVKVVERGDGTIDSYAVIDKEPTGDLVVAELACSDWTRLPLLLRLLVAEAVRRNNDHIRFLMPANYPVTHYLKQVGAEVRTIYSPDGAAMGRIIDLGRTMEAVLGLFERRLRESQWKDRPGQFSVSTDLGNVVFDWNGRTLRARVTHDSDLRNVMVRCRQDVLMAALLGYIPGHQLGLFGADVTSGEEDRLRTLFPANEPFMWQTDWF